MEIGAVIVADVGLFYEFEFDLNHGKEAERTHSVPSCGSSLYGSVHAKKCNRGYEVHS